MDEDAGHESELERARHERRRWPLAAGMRRDRGIGLVCLAVFVATAALIVSLASALSAPAVNAEADGSERGVIVPSGPPEGEGVPVPPAVRRAGGRELREFKEGRSALNAAGCLACHRIGDVGNRRPGDPLSYVGSKLTARQIRRALVYPRPPMPSFKGLPRHKLRVLVRFLALLRHAAPVSGKDRQATHRYILALYEYEHTIATEVGMSKAAVDAQASGIEGRCAHLVKPRDARHSDWRLNDLMTEVQAALGIALDRSRRSPALKLVAQVAQLHWSDPRITGWIHGEADLLHERVSPREPDV